MSKKEDEFRDRKKNELIREIIELRAELEHRTQGTRVVAWSTTIRSLGMWLSLAIIAVALAWAATRWAGTITVLSADVSAAVSAEAEITFPQLEKLERKYQKLVGLFALFGVFGVIFGFRQKQLRHSVIKELHPFQEMYELEHDPRRSSSKLLKDGSTNPEDR